MGQVEGQSGFGWFPSACVVLLDEKEGILLIINIIIKLLLLLIYL